MKQIEEKLLKIYKEVYAECGVDFDEIKEKDRDGWFMHYYVPQETQDKILKKHLRWIRNEYIKKSISVNYHLGASPMSKDFYYRLERTDGLIKQSSRIRWMGYGENDNFKEWYNLPAVGRSLLMSPFSLRFTWLTTLVTEILEESRDLIRFKTENSEYLLIRILKDE